MTERVALVTGGASGIGRASCIALAAEGARVMVADLNGDGAAATARGLGDHGASVVMDVGCEADWERAMARIQERFGRLDILVNCAGIGVSGNAEDIEMAEWERVVAVNLTGTMLACKHGIRAMRAAKSTTGSIIAISSIAGVFAAPDLTAYCATKGGVTMLSKAVALNCAALGYDIRCNAIHPTYVDTEMLDPVAEQVGDRETMLGAMRENVPMGRLATAEDIAKSVVFLASDDSAMITGSTFLVDGGTTAGMPGRHS
nr:glucose 1-dehydrogenase [Parahaliea mediterranea]